MGIITLKRYLDGGCRAPEVAETASDLTALCRGLVREVQRVTGGTMAEKFAHHWSFIEAALLPAMAPAQQTLVRERVAEICTEYLKGRQEQERLRTTEMQQILATLNDALLAMASGSDKSVERLRQVETSLTRASQIDDIVALKRRLVETAQFVRAESEHQRQEAASALKGFEKELKQVQQSLSQGSGLPGRAAAIEAISELAKDEPDARVVVCMFQRLRALASRYGPAVSEDLMRRFVRERVELQARPGMVYRWTDDALVWAVSLNDPPAAPEEILDNGYEYRTLTGGRAALLTIAFRWVSYRLGDTAGANITNEVDEFVGGAPTRI